MLLHYYGLEVVSCGYHLGSWLSQLGLQNTMIASLQRSKTFPTNALDMTKQSDGEASVILELWGMQSTPSLALLPGPPLE